MPFDLIKCIWRVGVRTNFFKLEGKIYLFMFKSGGFSTLRTASQRWGCSVDGRVKVTSNEKCCHPHRRPHSQPSRCRTGPQVPLKAQQLVRWKKHSFIVYPPCLPLFDSWEMPKARPGATASVVLRAEMLEKSWLGFLQFSPDCNANNVASTTPRAFVPDKAKKPLWKIKNYWFFSTGPRQLMMINDGDVSPLPSEDHSNFCKLH